MSDPKEFNIVEDSEFNVVEPKEEFNVIEEGNWEPYVPTSVPSELVSTPAHIGGDPLLDVPLSKDKPTYGPGEYFESVKGRVGSGVSTGLDYLSKGLDKFTGVDSSEIKNAQFSPMAAPKAMPGGGPAGFGLKVMGGALNAFQEHVGKHVSAGLLNEVLGKKTQSILPSSLSLSMDSANDQDILIKAGVNYGPEKPPALADIRGKSKTEFLLRQALTFWAGNDFALNEEESLEAINQLNMNPTVLGGLMFMSDQVGSFPMFLFNPGAKAALAERQLLLKGARYADRPAKEIVKGLASVEARQGAKVGALQGGIQGAKDAQREGGDFDKSVAIGALSGGVLGRVMGYLGGRVGAKSAILKERNNAVTAVGLPAETWEQFVKEVNANLVEQKYRRNVMSEDLDAKITLGRERAVQPFDVGTHQKGLEVVQDWKELNTNEIPTYETPVFDQKGNIWIEGVKVRTRARPDAEIEKAGKVKLGPHTGAREFVTEVISRKRVTGEQLTKWRELQQMPSYMEPYESARDRKAYESLARSIFGDQDPKTLVGSGTVTHSPPEQMVERLNYEKARYNVENLAELRARQAAREKFAAMTPEQRANDKTPVFNRDSQQLEPTLESTKQNRPTIEVDSPFPAHDINQYQNEHGVNPYLDPNLDTGRGGGGYNGPLLRNRRDAYWHNPFNNAEGTTTSGLNADADWIAQFDPDAAVAFREQHGGGEDYIPSRERPELRTQEVDDKLHSDLMIIGRDGNQWDNPLRQRRAQILVNVDDGVVAIPVADNVAPRADKSIVQEGDLVTVPGGKALLVEKVNGQKVHGTVNGKPVIVEKAQVTPAKDVEHVDKMKSLFGPVASAAPKKQKDLLKLKKLTVQRVAAHEGIDVDAAAHLLGFMLRDGKVKTDGHGNFFPRKFEPKFGEGKPPVDPGMLVYYDVDPVSFNGKEGILRGPDPKKKGNYLIEIGEEGSLGPVVDIDSGRRMGPATPKQAALGAQTGIHPHQIYSRTKTISVDPTRMRSVMPQLWGNAKLSNLPEQYGMTKPMPPDTVVASTVTQQQIANYIKVAEKLNRPGLLGRIADKAKQQLFNEAFLGPPEVRKLSQSLFAQKALLAAQKQNYTDYLTGGLHGVLSKHDSALQKILKIKQAGGQVVTKQQIEVANYFAKHPELEAEVGQTISATLDGIKKNQEFLAANGFDSIAQNEAARAMGLTDEYETALYLRNMMGREKFQEFAQKHLPAEYERAIKLMTQRDPGKSWQTAQSEFLDLLDVNKDLELQELAGKGSSDAKKNLIARKSMQKEITDILGKVESAALGLAHSKAVSDTLVRRVNNWNSITASPYWSPGPRADLGMGGGVPVPNHPMFGKAAGGRVHESFKPLLEVKKLDADTNGLARALGSYWKFNVVPAGGFAPWVNNVMRNWKGMVFSGGLETPADFATFFEAAEMMLDYKRNPMVFGNNSQFVEAMTNGAVSTGFAANEINKIKTVNRVLEAVRRGKGTKTDVWEMLDGIRDSLTSTAQDVGAAYDTIDRLFKFTAYLNLKRKFTSLGYGPNDAAAMATMRINDSFPNYELVGPLVEKMRKGSVFAVAPFLTSKAEDMRVNAKMAMRLSNLGSADPTARQDAQALAVRLAGATAVLGGALKLNNEIGKVNGITDADRNKALDETKLASQAFRPGRFVLPYKDKLGRVQIGDTTPWDDTLMMLRIHPLDMDTMGGVTASIIRNNLAEIYGTETLPGIEIDRAFTQYAGLHPLTRQTPNTPRPGEGGIVPFLSYLAQHGGVPGIIPRMMQIAEKGKKNPNPRIAIQQELWTEDQQTMKQLGMPFAAPVTLGPGSPSTMGRVRELQQNTGEMKKQQRQVTMDNLDNPKEMKRLIKAKIDERIRLIKEFKNRGK